MFLGAEIAIIAGIAAAYGISAADRLRAEEVDGHAEPLLATTTTRTRWATSHYAVALAGTALLMVLAGLAIGASASASLGDWSQLGRVLVAALVQIPAVWVVTSLVLLLFGWLPRATVAVWGLLAAFIVVGEFGALWKLPEWVMDLSPLRHAPTLPVSSSGVLPVVPSPPWPWSCRSSATSAGAAATWSADRRTPRAADLLRTGRSQQWAASPRGADLRRC